MKDTKTNYKMTNSSENDKSEIDISLFLETVIRNKILIGSISFISFVIGCLYSFTMKRVWEGQFQIVLNTPKTQIDNPFLNLQNRNDDLATEVQKLKSPSVLMPIFEFARTSESKNVGNYSNFIKWKRKNLDIELIKKTSVLNIAYRDKNKEKIIPILEKMSNAYQEYSGIGKKRSSKLQIEYLKNQVSLYKEKSNISLRLAQDFATKEDLIFYDMNLAGMGRNTYMPLTNPNIILPNVNIENTRVEAANKIRTINVQLEKLNKIIDYEELKGFGTTIPGLLNNTAPSKIESLEENIAVLRSKYTEEDPTIKRKLIEKNQLIELLKQRANNYLVAQKSQAEAIMESAIRPKEVLMKYKELIREAARDENTLVILEDQLRKVSLESAKKEEPWELITKPTLLSNPVAPSRKVIGLRSLILGFIFGSVFVYFKEKNSGLIYNPEVLKRLISTKIISKIELKDSYEKDKEFEYLRDYLETNSTSTISFLLLDGIDSKDLESFKSQIKNNKLTFFRKLEDIKSLQLENSKYLILKLGFTKVSEIIYLRNYIELFSTNIEGIIIFKDNNPKTNPSIDNKIKLKLELIFIYLLQKISSSKLLKSLSNKMKSNSKSIFNNISDFLTKFLK